MEIEIVVGAMKIIDHPGYDIVDMVTIWGALKMRRIRNEIRGYMTHDTSHIGIIRQLGWYCGTYMAWRKRGLIWGYLLRRDGKGVGYGLVRKDLFTPRWWITGGILAAYRGLGLGRSLFEFLTWQAMHLGGEAWLDVRTTNTRAIKLYRDIGYSEVSTDGLVYVMKFIQKPLYNPSRHYL